MLARIVAKHKSNRLVETAAPQMINHESRHKQVE